jgi:hypothetical protein
VRSDEPLPLESKLDTKPPTLAPAWLPLVTAWLGLLMLAASVIFILLPGSRNPVAELQHQQPYSLKDRFLPVPMYGIALVLFLGSVVLWQMRREARPLPQALVNQRVQAMVGMGLALLGAVIIYAYVAFFGPRA